MNTLLILNDGAYGSERSYNGFRLARSLALREGQEVRVFLMGDAVTCAIAGQKTPDGYYNLETAARRPYAVSRAQHSPQRGQRPEHLLLLLRPLRRHPLDVAMHPAVQFPAPQHRRPIGSGQPGRARPG